MNRVVAETVPWLAAFDRDPAAAVAELLCGVADVAPYERAEPVDVLLMLFGGLPAEDERRLALDRSVSAWLASRRRDDPGKPQDYGLNRYGDELVQALGAVYRLPLPNTAKTLRRDLASFDLWLRSLYLGPGRDPAGELWRAMALTQRDRSLVEDWNRICAEAGRSLPDSWVDIGLLGLRRLPEPGSEEPAGILSAEILDGLFRWASRLPQDPASRKAFQGRLATLMVLYPRSPATWRELVLPLLEAYPHAPFRDWLGETLPLDGSADESSSPASSVESVAHRGRVLVDLSELRHGRGFERVWDRCIRYVRRYGQGRYLSLEDGEDIVSAAFQEESGSIMNRHLADEEVSIRLTRALNRTRARVARRRLAEAPEARDVADPSTREDPALLLHFKDIARTLSSFIGEAIDDLNARDRDLIIEQYSLDRLGFLRQGTAPDFPSENARKVALFRARQQFWKKMDRRLTEAEVANRHPDLIREVRELIRNSGLAAPVYRKIKEPNYLLHDRTTLNPKPQFLEEHLIEPGAVDGDAGLSQDQVFHLLLTAWPIVRMEQRRRGR